ncbi:MAG: cysteine desulfurase [Planctomycetota bacterium]
MKLKADRTPQSQTPCGSYDVEAIRCDFPILQTTNRGRALVYLDSAATTQKPTAVIEAISRFYREQNSNVHRGVHFLSEAATRAFEGARVKVQRFLHARDPREIVFCRGATEAINLVAWSWGRKYLQPGDEIVITTMEHHSNIVPWQMVGEETGARLRVVPITDEGEIALEEYARLLGPKTRIVSVAHVSNALGTINPVRRMIEMARGLSCAGASHEEAGHGEATGGGAPPVILVDGAQAVPHMTVNVRDLDCDFYAFSGHKMYGPTGIGGLYGKIERLEAMPPYQGGGDMIRSVTFEKTLYNDVPYKFEAGTPDIAGAVGLGAAIDYLEQLGLDAIQAREQELLGYATQAVGAIPGVTIIGHSRHKAGVLSFTVEGVHPHDVGTVLDQEGVAIRTGHHCAQPVMDRFGVPATARASLGLYNNRDDIDRLVLGLRKVLEIFH